MTKAHAHVNLTYANDTLRRLGPVFLDRVEGAVREETEAMLTRLGLKSDLVELSFMPDSAAKNGFLALSVGSDPCGTFRADSVTKPGDLASAIFAQIFANRDALIDQQVALAIWDELTAGHKALSGVQASRIQELIRRTVLFGCPPAEPLRQFEQMMVLDEVDEQWYLVAIEPFLSNAADEVAALVPKAAEQWNYSELAEGIRQYVFYFFGVNLTTLALKTCETPLDEALGEFRLQQGALVGPVHAAGTLEREDLQRAISDALSENLHLRFSIREFECTLASFIQAFPMPVFNAVEKIGTNKVLQVLRLLLEERVCIRDLRGILGAMLELNGGIVLDDQLLETYRPTDARLVPRACFTPNGLPTDEEFTDYVRLRLRHQLCRDLVKADTAKLVTHRVSGNVESRLKAAGVHPMSSVEKSLLSAAVASVLGENGNSSVLLTSFTLRRSLWHMLRRRFPRLRVLCPQELSPHVAFQIESDVDCVFPAPLRMNAHPRR